MSQTLKWQPPEGQFVGVINLALGSVTISIIQKPDVDGSCWIEVTTDQVFNLELIYNGLAQFKQCNPGFSRHQIASGDPQYS